MTIDERIDALVAELPLRTVYEVDNARVHIKRSLLETARDQRHVICEALGDCPRETFGSAVGVRKTYIEFYRAHGAAMNAEIK
jgi:hypothetical protein